MGIFNTTSKRELEAEVEYYEQLARIAEEEAERKKILVQQRCLQQIKNNERYNQLRIQNAKRSYENLKKKLNYDDQVDPSSILYNSSIDLQNTIHRSTLDMNKIDDLNNEFLSNFYI